MEVYFYLVISLLFGSSIVIAFVLIKLAYKFYRKLFTEVVGDKLGPFLGFSRTLNVRVSIALVSVIGGFVITYWIIKGMGFLFRLLAG